MQLLKISKEVSNQLQIQWAASEQKPSHVNIVTLIWHTCVLINTPILHI